jgi:hypothetical protein
MSSLSTLKDYLKGQACEITTTKQELKEYQRNNRGCDGGYYAAIDKLTYDYRHKHIAYCLMRGTPYESIEKPRQGNEPDMAFIQEIQNALTTNVCAGA